MFHFDDRTVPELLTPLPGPRARELIDRDEEVVQAATLMHMSGTDFYYRPQIEMEVDAVVDTRFEGKGGRSVLADGSIVSIDVCIVEVEWDGAWETVLTTVLEDETLIGMRILHGHELRVEAVPGAR